jgi:LysR family transcriptional activator of nhaA
MSHLNLKHLRYFWAVAKYGSIARAAEVLHLTPQTISGQLRELEEQVGSKLFSKSGRNLVPNEIGRLVFSYADDIFRLGDELQDVLAGRAPTGGMRLNVGIAMVVPKLLAHRILAPVLSMSDPVRLVCAERPLVDLLAELSVHKLDLILADSPLSPALNIRAYNHPLSESETSFFAAPTLAGALSEGFPQTLDGAPMLMPASGTALHRALQQWLESQEVRPRIVAEIEDRALMKTFGEAGAGIFTAPRSVEADVLAKYRVQVIGRAEDLKERLYAITAERRIKHPAVSVITEAARSGHFD